MELPKTTVTSPSLPSRALRPFSSATKSLFSQGIICFIWMLSNLASLILWVFTRSEFITAVVENHRSKSEKVKKASDRARGWKILAIASNHLLPVGATIILIAINFKAIFWEGAGSTNQNARLNALQFAAKIHEILIVTSLSSIVLCHVQYQLFRGNGIPFGGLFAGFQINNIGLLMTPGFWATALVKKKVSIYIFLYLSWSFPLYLAAIVGPVSAILMLPSLDWWEFPLSASAVLAEVGMTSSTILWFIGLDESKIWPVNIRSTNGFLPTDCNLTNSLNPDHCPAGGLSTLVEWATTVGPISNAGWNITMPTRSPYSFDVPVFSRFVQGLAGLDYLDPSQSLGDLPVWCMTQTTSAVIDNALSAIYNGIIPIDDLTRWKISLANGSQPLAPLTFSRCKMTVNKVSNGSIESVGPHLLFPLKYTSASSQESYWIADSQLLLDKWSWITNPFATIWIEPPDLGSDTPSIGAAIVANSIWGYEGLSTDPNIVKIVTSSLYAGWRASGVYIDIDDTASDFFIHAPDINDQFQLLKDWSYHGPHLPGIRNIRLGLDWKRAVLPANETARLFTSSLVNTSLSDWADGFGIAISILVADALARISIDNNLILAGDSDLPFPTAIAGPIQYFGFSQLPTNRTKFRIDRFRYGYSWYMRYITRRLAAGILLLHVLMTLIHTVVVVWSGWTCASLKTLWEVLALSINSTPSQALENTCSGIARLDTYKHNFKIREVSTEHLAFIVNDQGSLAIPVEGKL